MNSFPLYLFLSLHCLCSISFLHSYCAQHVKMAVAHWILCQLSCIVCTWLSSCTVYLTCCTSSLSPPQEPVPEAAAVLLRHPGVRFVRGHGSLLSDGGFPHPVRHVNLWNLVSHTPITCPPVFSPVSFLPCFLFPSLSSSGGRVSRAGTQNELVGHSNQQKKNTTATIFT